MDSPPSTPFCSHTILSQYSLVHSTRQLLLYSSASTHLFIPNSIHSRHSHQISQTLHLKNIHFPSLSTSHSPSFCFVQLLAQFLLHIDTSSGWSPIQYWLVHILALATLYTPHSSCVPHPFHIIHALSLATPDMWHTSLYIKMIIRFHCWKDCICYYVNLKFSCKGELKTFMFVLD